MKGFYVNSKTSMIAKIYEMLIAKFILPLLSSRKERNSPPFGDLGAQVILFQIKTHN